MSALESNRGGSERVDASLVQVRGLAVLDGLEGHAPGSREHGNAVATYAFATAVELGFERSASELIREVARLHEIGRLYVPRPIASRHRVELVEGELEQLEQSPAAGAALARGAGVPENACQWILTTRERYDGLGPAGLQAGEIPLPARIVRAACAFHELVQRPAAGGLSWDDTLGLALSELGRAASSLLDPAVVEALARLVARAAAATS